MSFFNITSHSANSIRRKNTLVSITMFSFLEFESVSKSLLFMANQGNECHYYKDYFIYELDQANDIEYKVLDVITYDQFCIQLKKLKMLK